MPRRYSAELFQGDDRYVSMTAGTVMEAADNTARFTSLYDILGRRLFATDARAPIGFDLSKKVC